MVRADWIASALSDRNNMYCNRYIFCALLSVVLSIQGNGQFKQLIIEQVENEGKVKGKTYRIFAELESEGDQVFVIFGDTQHPLSITSDEPFYQDDFGGALSKETNRKAARESKTLAFDSYLTVGATDNYENNVQVLKLDLTDFEEKGKGFGTTDGAWFCMPTDKQAYCGASKRILLMQLTTAGRIQGSINIMGKNKDGEAYTVNDVKIDSKK